jgi:hypothetical protein
MIVTSKGTVRHPGVAGHRQRAARPASDLLGLRLEINDAFETTDGHNLVDQIYDTWHELVRKHGITVAAASPN